VHNVQVCLHAALEEAVRNNLLRGNPADGSHRKPRDRPEMLTWSTEELRAFMTAVANQPDHAFYRTAVQTGMRRGELLGLRWRDLDLNRGVLNVRQQWSRQDNGPRFGPPKTKNALRSIYLDLWTVEVLLQHQQAQELERHCWGESYRTDLDLVFPGSHGLPQDPDVVQKRFARLVGRLSRRMGIRRIRFHDLRHTHATLLLEDGFDAKFVSERLGHDSVQTTLELYAHVTSKRRQEATQRIGAILDDEPESEPRTRGGPDVSSDDPD
jgi:integrase